MKALISSLLLFGVVSVANADVYIYVRGDGEVVTRERAVDLGALEATRGTAGANGLRPSEIAMLETLARERERRAARRAEAQRLRRIQADVPGEREQTCRALHRIMNDPHAMSRTVDNTEALYEYRKRGCTAGSSALSYELNPIAR